MLGLKINMYNSLSVGINVEKRLESLARILGCELGLATWRVTLELFGT